MVWETMCRVGESWDSDLPVLLGLDAGGCEEMERYETKLEIVEMGMHEMGQSGRRYGGE